MEDKDFSAKILDKIKDENIIPTPRWHFLLRNWVVWTIGIICIFSGGLAFAMIYHVLSFNDSELFQYFKRDNIYFVVPYIWLIFFVLLAFISDYNIRHTKQGYKYSLIYIILGSLLFSVLFGVCLVVFDFGKFLDKKISPISNFYRENINPHLGKWNRPQDGFLIGQITSILEDAVLLRDPTGKNWTIKVDTAQNNLILKNGMIIRVIGNEKLGNIFEADLIRPMPKNFPSFQSQDKRMKNDDIVPRIKKFNNRRGFCNRDDCQFYNDLKD